MINAIAPYAPPAKNGNQNVVQFASDGVAADVRVFSVDPRTRSRMYAVRLASTECDVTGRLVGHLPDGDVVDLGGLAVAPGSIGSARLHVAPPRAVDYQAVYLEIRSQHLLLRVEAPRPPRPRGLAPMAWCAVLIGAGIVATGGGFAALAFPQTPQLHAPASAVAGGDTHVAYATHGYGALSYTAVTDDGTQLAVGPVNAAAGELSIALPPSSAHRRVTVALAQHGPLGTTSSATDFVVAAAPPQPAAGHAAAPARVVSFSATRDQTAYGETVVTSYLAVGDRGTVALFDRTGKRVASAPFVHVGTNRLSVGDAYRAQPLLARITVQHGASTAVASVAVPPAGAAPATPAPASDPGAPAEAVTPVDHVGARTAHSGIVAVEGRAVAGAPLALRVEHPGTMHLEMQDETGETIAETDVAAGATRASLPLPPASAAQTYYLVVRYLRNGAEETVVRTIVATPR